MTNIRILKKKISECKIENVICSNGKKYLTFKLVYFNTFNNELKEYIEYDVTEKGILLLRTTNINHAIKKYNMTSIF